MTYTPKQIAAAARLVPGYIDSGLSAKFGKLTVLSPQPVVYREWQPWATTEAGRADALVLYLACKHWCAKNEWNGAIAAAFAHLQDIEDDNDTPAWQRAVTDLAVAIGESMGEAG